MIVLLGNASGGRMQNLISRRSDLGVLHTVSHWRYPTTRYYAVDNDVYAHREDPGWWFREGETAWLKMLDKIADWHLRPMFVTLPDVVADWPRTVERGFRYRDALWQRNLPVGLALQNGCDYTEALRLSPFTVFVGGTTEWKWRHAEEITRFFQGCDKRVHIGRASGPWRIRECLRLGVDSCDGSGWARFPDAMLPKLFRVLDGQDAQQRLAL